MVLHHTLLKSWSSTVLSPLLLARVLLCLSKIVQHLPPPTRTHTHTQVIVLTFLYFLLWLLITVAMGGIMVYYVQAELKCGELEAMGRMNDSSACFPYIDRSMWVFILPPLMSMSPCS